MSEPSRNELYQKTRDDLLKRQLSNNENFDRSILTLASAALALSVTFLNGARLHGCFALLVLSWIGFVMTIVLTIISYLTSQHGITRQLELAERYYLKNEEAALTAGNPAAAWTDRCGVASAVSFVVAIILLLTYFAVNLPKATEGSNMAKESKLVDNAAAIPSLQRVQGGASVPTMQAVPIEQRGATIPSMQPVAPVPQLPAASPAPTVSAPSTKQ